MNATARPFAHLARTAAMVAAVLAAAPLCGQDLTAYRGATVWTGTGAPIERGVVVTAKGRIQAVGDEHTAVPDGARVVDLGGRAITPGLIDASWTGDVPFADSSEQSSEVTPELRSLDALDPMAPAFLRARTQGVTTVHLMPGTRSVIGGMSALLKTWGTDPEAMVLAGEASLRIVLGDEPAMGNMAIDGGEIDSIYYRRPTTRMGVIWSVRKAFYEAKDWLAQSQGQGTQQVATRHQRGVEVVARVLQGTLPVVTTARSEQDLRTALRLAEEFGYTPIVDEAQDAYAVADELQKARVWVVVGAPSSDRVAGTAATDGAEPRFATLGRLQRGGVPFVIATGTNPLALPLVREATFAHRFGLSAEQALAAVTSQPAKMLGIQNRTGSLAPGLDADLVVWSTDPLDPSSQPVTVVVGGHETPVIR